MFDDDAKGPPPNCACVACAIALSAAIRAMEAKTAPSKTVFARETLDWLFPKGGS
jgi:hypothetical protein